MGFCSCHHSCSCILSFQFKNIYFNKKRNMLYVYTILGKMFNVVGSSSFNANVGSIFLPFGINIRCKLASKLIARLVPALCYIHLSPFQIESCVHLRTPAGNDCYCSILHRLSYCCCCCFSTSSIWNVFDMMHFENVQGTTKGRKKQYFKYSNDFEAHPNCLEYGLTCHRSFQFLWEVQKGILSKQSSVHSIKINHARIIIFEQKRKQNKL